MFCLKKSCAYIAFFIVILLFGIVSVSQNRLKEEVLIESPPDDNTYSTLLFTYSDTIHDLNHNLGYSEDEIYSWYDYVVTSQKTFYYIDDENKKKSFLYIDIWGKSSNLSRVEDVIPVPLNFITDNFPSGMPDVPSHQTSSGSPFCFVQTQEYFDDLLIMIDDFLAELEANGTSIHGIFLDDWANVPDYWDDSMSQAEMNLAWPGRGSTQEEKNGWWINSQYPRMVQFESDLHDLLYSYYGKSDLITNGGARNFRNNLQGEKEPYFYNNSDYPETINKITRRTFEGPTIDTRNHLNFDVLFAEFGSPNYKYWRKVFKYDNILMYSIDGDPGDSENGDYGDWYVGSASGHDYDGYNDWMTALDGAVNVGDEVLISLSYATTPYTGGTRLSLFSNPNENPWPYQKKEMNINLEPGWNFISVPFILDDTLISQFESNLVLSYSGEWLVNYGSIQEISDIEIM